MVKGVIEGSNRYSWWVS